MYLGISGVASGCLEVLRHPAGHDHFGDAKVGAIHFETDFEIGMWNNPRNTNRKNGDLKERVSSYLIEPVIVHQISEKMT